MKYLRKFDTHSEYAAYKDSQDYTQPNVSWCVDFDDVHYDMWIPPETRIIAKFYNNTEGGGMQFFGFTTGLKENVDTRDLFSAFEYPRPSDGVNIIVNEPAMNFAINPDTGKTTSGFSVGEIHTYYTLKDETTLGSNAFLNCGQLETLVLPSCITTIGSGAFGGCILDSITCMSTTPPTVYRAAFDNIAVIYVPEGSVSAYQSANNWSTYAQKIRSMPTA